MPVQMRPLGEMFVKDDDPIVYRGLPVWYRDLTRGTLRVYRSGYQQREGNRHCRKAMWQALGYRYRRQPSNWEGCHIWTTDSRSNRIVVDPDYYTCLANLVALPKKLAPFSDHDPEIKFMLRMCTCYLYGWCCPAEEVEAEVARVKSAADPSNYPMTWPSLEFAQAKSRRAFVRIILKSPKALQEERRHRSSRVFQKL